jgi:hypothetical protein
MCKGQLLRAKGGRGSKVAWRYETASCLMLAEGEGEAEAVGSLAGRNVFDPASRTSECEQNDNKKGFVVTCPKLRCGGVGTAHRLFLAPSANYETKPVTVRIADPSLRTRASAAMSRIDGDRILWKNASSISCHLKLRKSSKTATPNATPINNNSAGVIESIRLGL